MQLSGGSADSGGVDQTANVINTLNQILAVNQLILQALNNISVQLSGPVVPVVLDIQGSVPYT